MSMKVQEQKVRLLNHLSSQLEQIIDLVPDLKGKYDPQSYKSIHSITARIKTFTAKNKNSNLYKIFSSMEEQVFKLSKFKETAPPHEVEHLEKLIGMAKEQLGLIFKGLVIESNVNGLITHSDIGNEFDKQISCLEKGSGYLKISYGGQDISMFSKEKNNLLNQWYEQSTPINRNGGSVSRRDAFTNALGELIDMKNSTTEENKDIHEKIENLCSKFESLQSVALKPLISNIAERTKSLSLDVEKPLDTQLNIDDVNIPENLLEPIVNFFNSLFELIVLNNLESSELRSSRGKSLPYHLNITVENNEFYLKVKVTDDGKGKELLCTLDSINNHKASILKTVMKDYSIDFSETNFLGRESSYEFTIPMEPWFFKAYMIHSNSRDYFIPMAQVKSFVRMSNDFVVDAKYIYGNTHMRYFNAGGKVPKDLNNKIGILHVNENGDKQILVCDTISEPSYIRIKDRTQKDAEYLGTAVWKDQKLVSIFDVRKLCLKKSENVLGIG